MNKQIASQIVLGCLVVFVFSTSFLVSTNANNLIADYLDVTAKYEEVRSQEVMTDEYNDRFDGIIWPHGYYNGMRRVDTWTWEEAVAYETLLIEKGITDG